MNTQQLVKEFSKLPQVTTTIDVVLLGEMLGRNLWPSEYAQVLDVIFAGNDTAKATAKAAADVICERKLIQMEEEYEYSRAFSA